MARERDPKRDLAFQMWKESKGKITNREISNKLDVDEKKIATWKVRDNWNCSTTKKNVVQQKNKCSTTNKKKVKEVAKTLIETGYTISEVSDKVGLPRSTIGDISSKNNLQQSQLEHLKAFRDKQRERILMNKAKRLDANEVALKAIEAEIYDWDERGGISKSTMEKLMLNEKLEQDVLELDRIERLEKLENDKKQNSGEDKVVSILDKLEVALDEAD